MKNEHGLNRPPSLDSINLETMTIRGFGKEAEGRGKLASTLLAEYVRRPAALEQRE